MYITSQNIAAPNFDRNGKLLYNSWLWKLVLLGAERPKAGLLRWFLGAVGMCAVFLLF
jgi:hypothetical protein